MTIITDKYDELDSFVFYPSFWVRYQHMPENVDKAKFLEAICCYGATGEILPLEWPLDEIFEQCAVSIDASRSRHESSSNGGKKGSNRSKITKEQLEQRREETGSLMAAAKSFGIARSTAYNILNMSDTDVQRPNKRPGKRTVSSKQVTNTYTNTYTLMGDTDKSCSHGEKTKEIISGSRGDPEKISEASAQEAPEGCEWIGEPYESDGCLCRQYNRIGTTEVGVMRFPL